MKLEEKLGDIPNRPIYTLTVLQNYIRTKIIKAEKANSNLHQCKARRFECVHVGDAAEHGTDAPLRYWTITEHVGPSSGPHPHATGAHSSVATTH